MQQDRKVKIVTLWSCIPDHKLRCSKWSVNLLMSFYVVVWFRWLICRYGRDEIHSSGIMGNVKNLPIPFLWKFWFRELVVYYQPFFAPVFTIFLICLTFKHEAVNHGNATIAELLINYGASVNAPGLDNDTPLHDAVSNYRLDCVRLLMSKGANALAR